MQKINRYYLQGTIPILSDADVTEFAVPETGHLVQMLVVNEVVLTTGDEDLTISTVVAAGDASPDAVTGGVMVMPTSGTAVHKMHTLDIAESASSQVVAGTTIHVANDGACTSAGRAFITLTIHI